MAVMDEYYLLDEHIIEQMYEGEFRIKAVGFWNQVKYKELDSMSPKQIQ